MPKATDPFAGAKLTENVPTLAPGRDQRLFAPSSIRTPVPLTTDTPEEESSKDGTEPRNLGTYESRDLGAKEAKKGSKSRATTAPPTPTPTSTKRFPFDHRPGHQANFIFTDEELEAVEDLKTAARRKHGLTTTKQDIVRFAVIDLLEDYEATGEDSRLIRWLKQRSHRK